MKRLTTQELMDKGFLVRDNINLTKEQIYINLQGKTKEELTDLWEFLTSNREKCYRDKEYFSEYNSTYRTLHLYYDLWRGYDDEKVNNKTEITIPQLKQIIMYKPIAMKCTQEQFDAVKPKIKSITIGDITDFDLDKYLTNFYDDRELISNVCTSGSCKTYEAWNEEIFLKACGIEVETKFKKVDSIITDFDLKGFSVEVENEEQAKHLQEIAFKQGYEWGRGKNIKHLDKKFFLFNAYNKNIIYYSNIHFKDKYVTKKIHFNNMFKETLQEKAIRLENELNEVKQQIKEENKPNFGDWIYDTKRVSFYKKITQGVYSEQRKITNPELIKLLENECSTKN